MSWASFAEGVGGAVGGRVFDRFADDIFGIPGPSGKELGKRSLDYFNAAFPGTNPWERLGSPSPASGMVAADAAQRNQNRQASTAFRIKKDELKTSERNVDKQTETQDRVSERDLAGKIIQAEAQENSARIAASGAQGAANLSGGWSFRGAQESAGAVKYGADTAAGATTFAAQTAAGATVQSAEISQTATMFAARVGAQATLDAADTAADANMFSSVMQTGDPHLIRTYFKMSGRNPATIAGTLKSDEVNAAILKMDSETLGIIADNFIKNAEVAFANEMAKAKLTSEQTRGIWTWLENVMQGHNAGSGFVVATLSGVGMVGRGIMGIYRAVASRVKTRVHTTTRGSRLEDAITGRGGTRYTTETTRSSGKSWRDSLRRWWKD